ncbi:hypothetical protein [Pseudoteredinibacter isoporae]|uniref:IrrE N-terminal-like domain-containing protein n=1 Tax=Pseudoteredinibacter isoporae TaxID=570281 RepID=A0A7X0JS38_9GAMM|nr:hypothetical protein [Pseudoteredinibacter isoporae]MBB6521274.1 hypothetical protein [Pseudoteredinibacter isoporae]NHO86832.1 hypothetical protein [Pseudoteredinibacter isoporae]NIB24716.1 hypothetical protein [Pseudoteredinibacter isoporae]
MFKSKPILSEEDRAFQVATFKWLLKHFGGKDFYVDTKLILPTNEFFPSKVGSAQEAAIETFHAVKKHAGMEEWPCRLEAQEEDVNPRLGSAVIVQNAPLTPMGTFQEKENEEVVITYNPALLNQPSQLVATFAHELSHYLTGSCSEEPPGGWENWEFATDITATFIGFGVFMANTAFGFHQYSGPDSMGWQSSRNGYMTEAEHVFSLAIFLGLKDISVETVSPHLKKNLNKLLKKASKEISNGDLIEELKAVEYRPPEPNTEV